MQTWVTDSSAQASVPRARTGANALGLHADGPIANARGQGMRNTDKRAQALGWFSIGLGLSQVLAPSAMNRLVGTRDNESNRTLMLAIGLREITAGVAILTQEQPKGWLWARVAGDAMDLALLGRAFASPRAQTSNLALSTAAVAGVMALDWLTARDMPASQPRSASVQAERKRIKSTVAVTVNRSLEEVARGWRDYEDRRQTNLDVQFAAAPAGRGTEVRVQHEAGGGMSTLQELRHFKQVVETGEVVHSDASIHRGPHPARPSKANGSEVRS